MPKLTLEGQVEADVAALFVEQLAGVSKDDVPLTLDMSDAELEDGAVTATLVEAIRAAAERLGSLQILEPPQVLAHCLYRVGALGPASTIHLVEPREELGAAS